MKSKALLALSGIGLFALPTVNLAYARDLSRPLPSFTNPGLVEIQQTDAGPTFIHNDANGPRRIAALSELPLSEIKGNRKRAFTNKVGCYPAAVPLTCLIDLTADGEREIWLYRKATDANARTLVKLPEQVTDDLFWFPPRMSIAGDGPLTFASIPEPGEPAQVWVENGDPRMPFHSFSMPTTKNSVFVRPSFNGTQLAGLFLILSSDGERYATPANASAILAAGSDGSFATYSVPSDCEVMGAINDVVICGRHTRGDAPSSDAPEYQKVVRLRLPDGVEEDISRAAGAPAFVALEGSIIFRGMRAGVTRPYAQSVIGGQASLAIADHESCISADEHVDVLELSASRALAMLAIFGPLSPTRIILAPIDDGLIRPCSDRAKLFSQQLAQPLDTSAFRIERLQLGNVDKVPVTLISGGNEGPLSGHILLATYGIGSFVLREEFLGPWLHHWVAKGGKFAFVHLPGGGGYGPEWARSGFGIRRKREVSAMLDELTSQIVEAGLATDGRISLMTESAGGPLAAHAILRKPERYAAFALRAGCITFDGERHSACTRSHDYGNWNDPEDRQLMQQFDPLATMRTNKDFPKIVLGIPETDRSLSLDYQARMVRELAPVDALAFQFQGVDHTFRAAPEIEERWVMEIVAAALAEKD